MSDSDSVPQTVSTGRPLDDNGAPFDGPTLEVHANGRAARLLQKSPRPLASHPGGKTWATLLERPARGDSDRPVLLQWLAPESSDPPTHVHPSPETFEVLRGRLTVVRNGRCQQLGPGDAVTVEADVEHTFRNETDDFVAFRAELPSMKTVCSLYTVWGLDHEGTFGEAGEFGEPGPLHALVLSEDVYDETTSTLAPLSVQRALWMTVGRVARAMGYSGIDRSYLDEEFWCRHVEQPVFG